MKEALKLALEALENHSGNYKLSDAECVKHESAITALKEALAQPEQEPVAIVTSESGNSDVSMSWWHEPALPVGTKLYTTPPQRKPLTDEEYSALAEKYTGADGLDCVDFGRAVARHYGIEE